MPVLDSERQIAPRSALRYRPLHTDQAQPGSIGARKRRSQPDARITTAPARADDLDTEDCPPAPRPLPALRRKSTTTSPQTRTHLHPLFWLGVGALTLLVLWLGVSQLVNWGNGVLDDIKYGNPRTFQMDAVLGHHDSSAHPTHLLALNLHGEILVEEFPGGDVSQARSYILTTLAGPGSDQVIVTLRLIDPGHTGKPDLLVQVGPSESLLVNDQGSFRPPTPAERQQLLPFLQQG